MIIFMILGAIGAWIPDADLKIKHRIVLHNFLTCTLISISMYVLLFKVLENLTIQIPHITPLGLTIPFFLGYVSHLLTDLLTIYGVAILWPFNSSRFSIAKFRSNSLAFNVIGVLIATFIFAMKMYLLINPNIIKKVIEFLRLFRFLHNLNP